MRRLALALVAAGLLVACGRTKEPAAAPAGPSLQTVSLPDVSNASDAVQQQIRARFDALRATLDRPGASAADRAIAYGELGKLLTAAEYYDVARTCFENARALQPGDMRWPYFLGHVLRFKNDPAGAARLFEDARRLSPAHVPTLVWLAGMYLDLNRPGDAAPLLQQAASLDPASGAVLVGLGRVALARQDYQEAVRRFEAALAVAPSASRVHYQLALAYRGLGNRAKAEEHLRLRGDVDLPPADPLMAELAGLLQNAAAFETRGVEAMEARQWPDAVTNLRKAVELSPDHANTQMNLGTSLYMSGDADGALEHYRQAVRLSPDLARARFGIGAILETRHQDAAAIEAFTAAVQSDPGYVEAHFNLANALRRTGRVAESLPHYEAVLRLDPAVSQASFGYAMGLVRLGRYQEARDRLEQAVKAFPDQPGFAHALARLLAAAPDDRVRDGARALTLMQQLMKTEQQTLPLVATMAMALAETGRFEEAVRLQSQIVDAARQGGHPELASQLSVDLQRYRNRQPCRVPWTADDPVHHPEPAQ